VRRDDSERVVLLHITKTGGTSLSELLRRWAGPGRARVGLPLDDLALMSRPLLARLRAIAGHFPYEALDVIPGQFRSCTVVREPVDRTLSHYRWLVRTAGAAHGLTLDEFLRSERYAAAAGNYQARFLAHTVDIAGAWVDYSPMQRYLQAGGELGQPHPLQALFGSTPIPLTDDELLARATANLASIDFVGTTDDLDPLARRLAKAFGVRPEPAPRLSASGSNPGRDLPAPDRRRLEECTAVDRQLYELARRLSEA
jgi:hypothetical protein